MSHTILFEIGLEEMPARFVRNSMEQFEERMVAFLKDRNIPFGTVEAFATPRRLAVLVQNVAEKQSDSVIISKGPAKKIAFDEAGNWTKAAQGFARGQKVSVDDLYFEEIKGVEYIHARVEVKGQETKSLLSELPTIIEAMRFPVTMRWGSQTFDFIRPIHWITALVDEEVIPFTFLSIESGRTSKGHRFLGNDAVINDASLYKEALRAQSVLVDMDERKSLIEEQIQSLAINRNWKMNLDESLLEEVVSLVEYPTAFAGGFDEKYLALPDEVLITSMKEHQRYFEVRNQEGTLLPFFVAVRNGNAEHINTVQKGNEKVLTARLEDGLFFFNEDKKIAIDTQVAKMDALSFHAKIGSVADKMKRTKQISSLLAPAFGLSEEEQAQLDRAASIYKFDLVSNMVGEFPELQGLMGEQYALQQGESVDVATAIREHYYPIASDAVLPESTIGAVLAVSDKLDSVISFFQHGMIPTGSNDPYALRRQMNGVVQIIEEFGWSVSLDEWFEELLASVYRMEGAEKERLVAELLSFTDARIQQRMQSEGISHDVQEAVLAANEKNIVTILSYAKVLTNARGNAHFKEAVEALSRVLNLAEKAEAPYEVNASVFETASEKNLYVQGNHIQTIWRSASSNEKWEALEALEPAITAFFAENMVMVDDVRIRTNRLNTLANVGKSILAFADVRKLIKK